MRFPLTFEVSLYVISAICGNFWQESTINPGLFEGRKVVDIFDPTVYGGYGLGQWTNSTTYDVYRRTELGEWLVAHNFALDSGQGQLEFLLTEDIWYDKGVAAEYGSLEDYLRSDSTDIDLLVEQYMLGWEGIRDLSLPTRKEAAHTVYSYIQDHINDPRGEWIANNTYLSEADRLHNALLVYDFFNGVMPGPEKKEKRSTLVPILSSPLHSRLRRRISRCQGLIRKTTRPGYHAWRKPQMPTLSLWGLLRSYEPTIRSP